MTARRVILACGLALVLLSPACNAPPRDVPLELLGRWTADDARFAGRALEMRPGSVTFVTGIEPPTTHAIVGVVTEDGAERRYEIHYLVDGDDEVTLALLFDAATGSLNLENRPEVRWKRDDA